MIPFHPLADLFPLLEGAAFDEFVADIKQNGVRFPIVLFEGKILDGRNRAIACERVGIEPPSVQFDGDSALKFVISTNLRRRHLRDGQRALIAARLANMAQGRRTDRARATGELSQTEAAQLLNVRSRTVRWGKEVHRHAISEITNLVERGQLSVSAAGKVSRLPAAKQEELIENGPSAIVAEARKLDHKIGRHGRSEYSILWQCLDHISDALRKCRLDQADIAAAKFRQEVSRISASRRKRA